MQTKWKPAPHLKANDLLVLRAEETKLVNIVPVIDAVPYDKESELEPRYRRGKFGFTAVTTSYNVPGPDHSIVAVKADPLLYRDNEQVEVVA